MSRLSYLQPFGDVELAVRRHGEGIPLVWGHGLMGSVRVDDLAALCRWDEIEQHAHLVRYDARGHGNSDGGYTPEDYRWEKLVSGCSRCGIQAVDRTNRCTAKTGCS